MAYDRAMDIVRLAIRLQGTGNGLTLDDIQREFEISRRTAERLRNAVEELFGPLETVPTGEPERRCRLHAPILRRLISLSAEELAELPAAATALDRADLEERALMLRRLDDKLRALLEAETLNGVEPDLQALIKAEALAMRHAGPRPRLEDGLIAVLRQAVKNGRIVAFDYASRSTGRRTRRRAEPHGLVYGNRAFLVGRAEHEAGMRLWRLARMSAAEVTGERDTESERRDAGPIPPQPRRILQLLPAPGSGVRRQHARPHPSARPRRGRGSAHVVHPAPSPPTGDHHLPLRRPPRGAGHPEVPCSGDHHSAPRQPLVEHDHPKLRQRQRPRPVLGFLERPPLADRCPMTIALCRRWARRRVTSPG